MEYSFFKNPIMDKPEASQPKKVLKSLKMSKNFKGN